jgi:NADH-quinone oxidoreductase subunit M
VLSSVGLPLMNGFVGEFLVLSGAFQAKAIYGILAASGVIWGAGYLLWMYQKVFYGPIHHEKNKSLPDIDGREQISLWPLAVMALIMGVVSPYWMKSIDPAVVSVIKQDKTTAGLLQTAQPAIDKTSSATTSETIPAASAGGQK